MNNAARNIASIRTWNNMTSLLIAFHTQLLCRVSELHKLHVNFFPPPDVKYFIALKQFTNDIQGYKL